MKINKGDKGELEAVRRGKVGRPRDRGGKAARTHHGGRDAVIVTVHGGSSSSVLHC